MTSTGSAGEPVTTSVRRPFWRFCKPPIRIGRIIGDQLPALLHHFGRNVCEKKGRNIR